MSDGSQHPVPETDEQLRHYLAEVEPLVVAIGLNVRDDRVFLGWLRDLLPSRTRSAQQLTTADRAWLAALEQVVQRHQLSYELITYAGAEDALWLTPPQPTPIPRPRHRE
jgi:hypothetical protein